MNKVKIRVLEYIKNILFSKMFFVDKRTTYEDVHKFIKSLKPQKTNIELIRIGNEKDGGYLLPNDLENIEACYSPGVGKVSGFEKELCERGIKAFLADKSVQNVPEFHEKMYFIKKFVGCYNSEDFITLDKWIEENQENHESDLILQYGY